MPKFIFSVQRLLWDLWASRGKEDCRTPDSASMLSDMLLPETLLSGMWEKMQVLGSC